MNYKLGIMVLVATVVGISAFVIAGSGGTPSSVKTTSSPANATGTTITQDISSLTANGCGDLVKNETGEGYEVETFLSSSSLKTGDYLCIDLVVMNLNGTQLTDGTGPDLAVSYNVTSSSGLVVYQTSCSPTEPVQVSSVDVLSQPLRGLTCSSAWNTNAPVDGTVPAPGTYEISVVASVPIANGAGEASVAYSTPVTLSTA